MTDDADWRIYRGDGSETPDRLAQLPEAPPWRQFARFATHRAERFRPPKGVVEAVNAALYLRRPVLVTGDPGTGKSSLAYAIARELGLGKVLPWYVNSRSTRLEGLYEYDALSRLREANFERMAEAAHPVGAPGAAPAPRRRDSEDLGRFITLGAIGTAFVAPPGAPRVVLIDEIDKSDIDLPNDLLHVLEEGEFTITELARHADREASIRVNTADRRRTRADQGGTGAVRRIPDRGDHQQRGARPSAGLPAALPAHRASAPDRGGAAGDRHDPPPRR